MFVKKHLNKCEINVWDLLPNLKIKIFSYTTKKTHETFVTVRADRDLFGRLLMASNARQIDLKEVLRKFLTELLTVPFALARQDGSFQKNTDVFAKILEFEDQMHVVLSLPPSTALKAVYIIDGMAMIQILKSAAASTFGELAWNYYTSTAAPLLQSNCNEVHVRRFLSVLGVFHKGRRAYEKRKF